MNEILDWNINYKTKAAEMAAEYKHKMKEELEFVL